MLIGDVMGTAVLSWWWCLLYRAALMRYDLAAHPAGREVTHLAIHPGGERVNQALAKTFATGEDTFVAAATDCPGVAAYSQRGMRTPGADIWTRAPAKILSARCASCCFYQSRVLPATLGRSECELAARPNLPPVINATGIMHPTTKAAVPPCGPEALQAKCAHLCASSKLN